MKFDVFNKSFEEMGQSNKLLLAIVLVLAMAVLLQGFMMLTRRETVVLVPPYIDKRMEVAWNKSNRAYYEAFAVQIATMVGNISPQNLDFVVDYLGIVMSSQVYMQVKPQLLAYGEDPGFKRGTVFTYFTPTAVRFEDQVNKFFVSGFLNSAPMQVSTMPGANRMDSKAITYEMQFNMHNGRPVVIAFQSYEGHKPRTQEWQKNNERRQEVLDEQGKEQTVK